MFAIGDRVPAFPRSRTLGGPACICASSSSALKSSMVPATASGARTVPSAGWSRKSASSRGPCVTVTAKPRTWRSRTCWPGRSVSPPCAGWMSSRPPHATRGSAPNVITLPAGVRPNPVRTGEPVAGRPQRRHAGWDGVMGLLDALDRLAAATHAVLGSATSVAEIARLQQAGRLAAVLAIENGSALGGDVDHLDAVYQRGVRMMSLTWNSSNGLADGAMESRHGGLTPLGRQVLTRMQQLGMIVDVSHLSAKSFWDVLAATQGPI